MTLLRYSADFISKMYASQSRVVMVCACLSLFLFALDVLTPQGVTIGLFYIAVILLSLWAKPLKVTVAFAVASTGLILIGMELSHPGPPVRYEYLNRLLAIAVIWSTTIISLHRKRLIVENAKALHDRAEALMHVKRLQGMLPICASCKKIRNDKGYWTEIESYLSMHTDAEFSHGLCPDCIRKLYPEMADAVLNRDQSKA